jgi:hypothetical protein
MTTETATVTPSVLNPPKNGVAPKTPETPVTPPKESAPDPVAQREAQLNAREEAIKAREAKYQNELKKNASEKSGLGAKLSEHSKMAGALKALGITVEDLESARVNSPGFLGKLYGEKYQEVVNSAAINGVPPADLIASELRRMSADFERRLEERDAKAAEATKTASQQQFEQMRNETVNACADFYNKGAAEYPVFKKLGDAQRVGEMLTARIEMFAKQGKEISIKEAADGLEGDVLGLLDEAIQHEKYKGRLQSKANPATVSESSGSQGVQSSTRRTLSNNLTATTTGKAPPRSDEERFQRSMEAFNSARAKST